MSKSIYSPNNIQEAIQLAETFSNCGRFNPQEILMLHACFGHHYGGNMGLTMTQGYILKDSPALNADAMAGIVRKSGLCRFIKIVSWDNTHCSMSFARNDEDFSHDFSYDWGMAENQGLTRKGNWRSMPKQMLRSRCLTMGLRAVFPEAVSGIYSADEIADNTNMSDKERLEISAQALGEEVNVKAISSNPPAAQPAPAVQAALSKLKEVKEPAPQHTQTVVKAEEPQANPAGRNLRTFNGWKSFVSYFNSKPDTVQAALEMKSLNPQKMTEGEMYLHCIGPLSNRGFRFFDKTSLDLIRQEDAKTLVEEFNQFYGPMALETYEEDYKEALAAYIATQSKPWQVELIFTLKNLHIVLDPDVFEDLKKNTLACNNWLEYASLNRYIQKKTKEINIHELD